MRDPKKRADWGRAYREKNRERLRTFSKEWSRKNREKINNKNRERYQANPEFYRRKDRAYRARNHKRILERVRSYGELKREWQRAWYRRNSKIAIAKNLEWKRGLSKEAKLKRYARAKARIKNDPIRLAAFNNRARLYLKSQREVLSDSYIKRLVDPRIATPGLIKAKRELLKVKRFLRNIKETAHEDANR